MRRLENQRAFVAMAEGGVLKTAGGVIMTGVCEEALAVAARSCERSATD